LEAFLRCFVHSCPKQWSKWLSVAEFWYNTSYQTAIGLTPFQALYGHTPSQLGISDTTTCVVSDLAEWLKERNLLTILIQQQLIRARQRMKHQADKSRSERIFQVGDMVYLKLHPHIQSSVAPRGNAKLIYKFYGLYSILEKVGEVAYKLGLPAHVQIHSVVHVSQLKKHIPPLIEVSNDLSFVATDPQEESLPLHVLERVLIPKAGSTLSCIHVKWGPPGKELVTYEDEVDLQRRFPSAPAWGQAGFLAGGNVMTKAAIKV
jgi:hypothetical protein